MKMIKYLHISNPYPPYQPYREVDITNLLITGLFIGIIIYLFMCRLYDWNRKRTKYIEHRKPNGWKYEVPFYRAYCKTHGFYETSLQGWEKELRCSKCIAERDDKYES